jgi:hypothetical protein
MALTSSLANGQRAQRKLLVTAVGWDETIQIIGARTEDSSIEFNPDIQTSTDIRGNTYTDVEKTEPQQTLDPHYILGGSPLDTYLTEAVLKNDIDKYNGVFDVYIITVWLTETGGNYYAVKHSGCSIFPTAIGGSTYTSMPIEIHFSNNITEGTVNEIADNFTFTPKP